MRLTATQVLIIKDAVRRRDGYRCTKCGISNADHLTRYSKTLHVHRLDPGSVYTVEGCETLCYQCHAGEPKKVRVETRLAAELRAAVAPLVPDADVARVAEAAKWTVADLRRWLKGWRVVTELPRLERLADVVGVRMTVVGHDRPPADLPGPERLATMFGIPDDSP
jgi:hypothetical protein